MEGSEGLSAYKTNPLNYVYLNFLTRINQNELNSYLRFVTKAKSVQDLQNKLIQAGTVLNSLNAFDECHIEVQPGNQVNSAIVNFKLQEKRFLTESFDITSDPLGLKYSFLFRNLSNSLSDLNIKFGYILSSERFTFDYTQSSKGLINHYNIGFSLGKKSEFIDANIEELLYYLECFAKPFNKIHNFSIGLHLRSNIISTDNCSLEVLKNAFIPSEKTFLAYQFHPAAFPFLGQQLKFGFSDEVMISSTFFLNKLVGKAESILKFSRGLRLELNFEAGAIMPLFNSPVLLNEKFRYLNFKGFNYLGRRAAAHDQFLAERLVNVGDNLGTNYKFSFEAMLFKDPYPLFSRFGMHPYLFFASAYLPEQQNWQRNLRASAGFGIKWNLGMSVINLVYTSKTWAQPGDTSAEFQFFITDNA